MLLQCFAGWSRAFWKPAKAFWFEQRDNLLATAREDWLRQVSCARSLGSGAFRAVSRSRSSQRTESSVLRSLPTLTRQYADSLSVINRWKHSARNFVSLKTFAVLTQERNFVMNYNESSWKGVTLRLDLIRLRDTNSLC